jgi:hypothetical protein
MFIDEKKKQSIIRLKILAIKISLNYRLLSNKCKTMIVNNTVQCAADHLKKIYLLQTIITSYYCLRY